MDTRRPSKRPRTEEETGTTTNTPNSSTASTTPATHTPATDTIMTTSTDSSLTSASSSSAQTKLASLQQAFADALDRGLTIEASVATFLAALPEDVRNHDRHSKQIELLTRKVLNSVRTNSLLEFEVILGEHQLPVKLGEIDHMIAHHRQQPPSTTSSSSATSANAAASTSSSSVLTPDQFILSVQKIVRETELERLGGKVKEIDQENETLQQEITRLKAQLDQRQKQIKEKALVNEKKFQALKGAATKKE